MVAFTYIRDALQPMTPGAMSTMYPRITPRSQWPKGHSTVNAWHLSKHLGPLFQSTDMIAARFPEANAQAMLPATAISGLVEFATTADSVYDATAALDRLFDAYESFPQTLEAFEQRFAASDKKARKRIVGSLGYLLRDGENRRPPLGKHFTEIFADAQFFKDLATRADLLKNGAA